MRKPYELRRMNNDEPLLELKRLPHGTTTSHTLFSVNYGKTQVTLCFSCTTFATDRGMCPPPGTVVQLYQFLSLAQTGSDLYLSPPASVRCWNEYFSPGYFSSKNPYFRPQLFGFLSHRNTHETLCPPPPQEEWLHSSTSKAFSTLLRGTSSWISKWFLMSKVDY